MRRCEPEIAVETKEILPPSLRSIERLLAGGRAGQVANPALKARAAALGGLPG